MLTSKQKAFVAAYTGAARGVGSQAARLAGYSGCARGLANRAQECLRNPLVREAIARAARGEHDANIASVEQAQSLLTELMRSTKVPAAARIKAAVELCKMQGAYVTRVEMSGPDGGPMEMRQRLPVRELSEDALEELERVLLARDASLMPGQH